MKIYPNLDVELCYQNCGTQWLIILQGKESDINLTFNGLFNLKATNGELEWAGETTAHFWSTPRKMREFFHNHFCLVCNLPMSKRETHAQVFAEMRIQELKEQSITFINFNYEVSADEGYSMGADNSARPDSDMKDALLSNAYKDTTPERKREVETDFELAND